MCLITFTPSNTSWSPQHHHHYCRGRRYHSGFATTETHRPAPWTAFLLLREAKDEAAMVVAAVAGYNPYPIILLHLSISSIDPPFITNSHTSICLTWFRNTNSSLERYSATYSQVWFMSVESAGRLEVCSVGFLGFLSVWVTFVDQCWVKVRIEMATHLPINPPPHLLLCFPLSQHHQRNQFWRSMSSSAHHRVHRRHSSVGRSRIFCSVDLWRIVANRLTVCRTYVWVSRVIWFWPRHTHTHTHSYTHVHNRVDKKAEHRSAQPERLTEPMAFDGFQPATHAHTHKIKFWIYPKKRREKPVGVVKETSRAHRQPSFTLSMVRNTRTRSAHTRIKD